MLEKKAGACPNCESMAISIQSKSGFRDLYKCEGCGALLQPENKSNISRTIIFGTSILILISLLIVYYFSHAAFSIYFLMLGFSVCIFEVIFGIRKLLKPNSFKIIAKP